MAKNKTTGFAAGILAATMALLMFAGTASAYSVTHNGGSYYTAGSPPTYQFTADPNATCFQFNNGDTMTFIDQLSVNDVGGAGAVTVTFTLDIYEWIGARGPHLGATFSVITAQVGQTVTGTNSLTATYTNWNGPNSCWTFEVVRSTDDGSGPHWSSVVY